MPLGSSLPLPPPPIFLLRPFFSAFIRHMGRRHPELFDRLGSHGRCRFLIDPTDLPFFLILTPDPVLPSLVPQARQNIKNLPPHDARIAGPLLKLVGLIQGAYDGDALFFSRDLEIQGDTEAVLALRNAIDDSEIDLVAEFAAMAGPAAPAVHALERMAGAMLPELRKFRARIAHLPLPPLPGSLGKPTRSQSS